MTRTLKFLSVTWFNHFREAYNKINVGTRQHFEYCEQQNVSQWHTRETQLLTSFWFVSTQRCHTRSMSAPGNGRCSENNQGCFLLTIWICHSREPGKYSVHISYGHIMYLLMLRTLVLVSLFNMTAVSTWEVWHLGNHFLWRFLIIFNCKASVGTRVEPAPKSR